MLLSDCTRLLLSMQASTRAAEGGKDDHKSFQKNTHRVNLLPPRRNVLKNIYKIQNFSTWKIVALLVSMYSISLSLSALFKSMFRKGNTKRWKVGQTTTHNSRERTDPTPTHLYSLLSFQNINKNTSKSFFYGSEFLMYFINYPRSHRFWFGIKKNLKNLKICLS